MIHGSLGNREERRPLMVQNNRRMASYIVLLALLTILPLSSGAQGLGFSLNGVRFTSQLVSGVPLPVGLDVQFDIPISQSGFIWSLRLAGGYEDRMILRNDTTGDSIPEPAWNKAVQDNWFFWPNAEVDTGLVYRIRFATQYQEKSKVDVFTLARGRYEQNSKVLAAGLFPDAQNLMAVSGIAGVGYDTVFLCPRRMKFGSAGEISIEYAPAFLDFAARTDFYRANAKLEAYLPLFSRGEDNLRAFSVYAAGYLTADYAGGTNIPLYVLTSFGGRELRRGIGDSIRGYQPWGYEATTKAEASLEIRAVGPGLFKSEAIRPMAYLFGDAGYYAGLSRTTLAQDHGMLASAGVGAALDIFDFAFLGVRAGYKFPIDDPLDAVYFPGGEKFFWNIAFLLHF